MDLLELTVILMLKLEFLRLMLKMAKTETTGLSYNIYGLMMIEKNG